MKRTTSRGSASKNGSRTFIPPVGLGMISMFSSSSLYFECEIIPASTVTHSGMTTPSSFTCGARFCRI